jgi:serine/threonine protein kinase
MLANLNHPHLVRVTDYFIIPDQGQYLVMDFVEGIDLQTALINYGKALPLADTLKWTLQICDALTYIHSQNPPIIHRDIKPANIRITSQGNAVLVDFGLAKTFEANAKTSTGARGLTPYFAAPEQYGMGGTDAQSDIYSLGVTLYCMLTNHVPPDSVDIMVGNAEPPPPAKAINQNIPDSISDALQCAMQIRRTDRYKSVIDLKNAISNTTIEVTQNNTVVAAKSGEDSYLGAILADPDNHSNYYNLGKILRDEKLEEIYRKAIAIKPTAVNIYWELSLVLLHQQRPHEAESVCHSAIDANPTNASAYSHLCSVLKALHRLKEAEEVYREAIRINPTNAEIYTKFGIFLQDQDRAKEAEEVYRKGITADPTYPGNYEELANLLLRNKNRVDEIYELYCKGIDANPTDARFYIMLGEFLEYYNMEEAEKVYRKAIAIDPDYAIAYYLLGQILEEQERMKEAEDAYRKAITVNPNYANAYFNLGVLFDNQNRMKEAEDAYRKAGTTTGGWGSPPTAKAYNNLGVLLERQNRMREAEEAYRKATAGFGPTTAKAHNNLGNLLKAQNRIAEAEEAYREAAKFKDRWADIESRFGR